jgi:hypothetical protein
MMPIRLRYLQRLEGERQPPPYQLGFGVDSKPDARTGHWNLFGYSNGNR